MNFARVLISVCSGTEVFCKLLDFNPLRALFHLLLLIGLTSVFISVCRFFPMEASVSKLCSELSSRLGRIELSKEGVVPSKAPDKQASFILTPRFRLDYFPESSIALKDMDDWKPEMGLIWTPKAMLLWSRAAVGSYSVWRLPLYHGMPAEEFSVFASKEQIDSFLKKAMELKTDASGVAAKPEELLMDLFKAQFLGQLKGEIASWALPICMAHASAFLAANLIGISIFSLIIIFFFAAVQYMWVSGLSPRLRFWNVVVITSYSAFPALVVASFVHAFDLPVLSYQTVFFICFFIYHMAAFSRVQRFLAPPKSQNPSSWDDDDDSY